VSLSPSEPTSEANAEDYIQSLRDIFGLIQSRRSFSGSERNVVYMNTGGQRFANVSCASGLDFPDDCRGVAAVDWDHDGDVDLWLANRTAPRLRLMRNESPADHHYLAMLLEGVDCNRDAIGARVVVHSGDRKLMRSVRAGEGFRSQSSKWLLFGLGDDASIDRIDVRWPDGTSETLTGVEPDAHYLLVQGSGAAQPWTRPVPATGLTPRLLDGPKPMQQAAIALSDRVPMVSMPYRTFDGSERNVEDLAGAPVLVNLWASWCAPCKVELQGMIDNEAALRDAGVQVIALSVDGIDPVHGTSPADARAMLERMGFAFQGGVADKALIEKLEIFQNQLFEAHVPIPVPTSFLIDAGGNLAAIYRGPVESERVIRDSRLSPSRDALLAAAAPFPGRWHTPPTTANRLTLAELLLDNGYLHDMLKIMSIYRAQYIQENSQPPTMRQYVELATNAGAALSREGHMQIAAAVTQEAIMADPSAAKPRANLGSMLVRMGQADQGIEQLLAAVELEPDDANTRQLLGNALLDAGREDEAVEQFRRVIELDPNHADAHNNMGIILARQGASAEVLAHFADAVRLAPDNAHYRANLGRELLRQGKPDEAAEQLREAVRLNPQSPPLADAVARVIATSSLADRIDPLLAIRLAEQAVAQTQRRVPDALDTLAAAYANAGRFKEAAAIAHEGANLAREYDRPEIAQIIEQHAALYEAGKPYREQQ